MEMRKLARDGEQPKQTRMSRDLFPRDVAPGARFQCRDSSSLPLYATAAPASNLG